MRLPNLIPPSSVDPRPRRLGPRPGRAARAGTGLRRALRCHPRRVAVPGRSVRVCQQQQNGSYLCKP